MPIDIECILVKIFTHFRMHTVRTETLKDFCNYVATDYHQILGYCKTRWLAFLPAIKRLSEMFVPLKAYFLSDPKCPTILRSFFELESAELWLSFLEKQAIIFHDAVRKVEGQIVTIVDVAIVINETIEKYKERAEDRFIPSDIKRKMNNLNEKGDIEEQIVLFYENCVDYLQKWSKPFQDFSVFSWINIKKIPSWKDVEPSIEVISKHGINIDENLFYVEYTFLKKICAEKVSVWNAETIPVDARWREIFSDYKVHSLCFDNLLKVIEFILSLPGTNAPTERVFSAMNSIWTAEKNALKITTLKVMLCVKTNLNYTCVEFCEKLSQNKNMLEAIISSKKYKYCVNN